jgi:toxin ParE1/3/4
VARLSVSPHAKQDLVEVFLFIAQDNLEAAQRMHSEFQQTFLTIAGQPSMGRSRDELAAGIRSLAVGKYVIYYRRVGRAVRILRLLHGARDIEKLFR